MENLQQQINELKAEMNTLKTSNTIPLNVDEAFSGRGFARIGRNILIGGATLGAGGNTNISVPGANNRTVALVSGAWDSSPIVGSIVDNSGSYELHVEGTALDDFFFVIFLSDNTYNDID